MLLLSLLLKGQNMYNSVVVIANTIILKTLNKVKWQVKMLPEFSESYIEVMLDLYEGIMRVSNQFTFMLSSKEQA